MESSIINRVSGLLVLTAMLFAFNFNAMAQNDKIQEKNTGDNNKYQQTADELTQSLSVKVNLTEDQRAEISDALVGYQKDIADLDPELKDNERTGEINKFHSEVQTEIENVLNDNQMTAYNGVKAEWWRDVQIKIHPATVRQNSTEDKQY